jgi:hypothetical protein
VIIERDMVTGVERLVDSVKTPAKLWSRYCDAHDLDADQSAVVQRPSTATVVTPRAQ